MNNKKQEYQKQYYLDNKEKKKQYLKDNKEKIKIQKAEYYENNKEKINEYNKKYKENNKEKKNEYQKLYMREYRKTSKCQEYEKKYKKEYNKTENGLKINRLSSWRSRGLISEDYDKIYERYILTKECDNCGIVLDEDNNTKKCMDHCHQTGQFRNILCNLCNVNRY